MSKRLWAFLGTILAVLLLIGPTMALADPFEARPHEWRNKNTFKSTVTVDAGIYFEGSTEDTYKGYLTLVDPTASRTFTLPDYTGGIPLVIYQSATQIEAEGETESGCTLAVAANWFGAGKVLRWKIAGVMEGTTGHKSLKLYVDDAAILTIDIDSAVIGDYVAEFTVVEHTGTATQKCYCTFTAQNNSGVTQEADYGTDTTDITSAFNIWIDATSVSGDSITIEHVQIETWYKS